MNNIKIHLKTIVVMILFFIISYVGFFYPHSILWLCIVLALTFLFLILLYKFVYDMFKNIKNTKN